MLGWPPLFSSSWIHDEAAALLLVHMDPRRGGRALLLPRPDPRHGEPCRGPARRRPAVDERYTCTQRPQEAPPHILEAKLVPCRRARRPRRVTHLLSGNHPLPHLPHLQFYPSLNCSSAAPKGFTQSSSSR